MTSMNLEAKSHQGRMEQLEALAADWRQAADMFQRENVRLRVALQQIDCELSGDPSCYARMTAKRALDNK